MASGLPSPKKATLKIYTVGESNSKWTLLYCLGLMKYVPQFIGPLRGLLLLGFGSCLTLLRKV